MDFAEKKFDGNKGFPFDVEDVKEMYMLYSCAAREICAKFENLNQEFEMQKHRNPIRNIKHRIKTPESILHKMNKLGLKHDIEVVKKEIFDIAGVRVICSYVDDIYALSDLLTEQDDVIPVRIKDYIENPKPNGYRSYHIIVKVPVFLSEKKLMIPVEIQMRTIAMDFWASHEHQIKYKSEVDIPPGIINHLRDIAGKMFDADMEMQHIYKSVCMLSGRSKV